MADLYAAGASIEGEKILFVFGGWNGPNEKNGQRVGTLSDRGWAGVDKPLKRSTGGAPRDLDTLSCVSAAYASDDFRVNAKQKVVIKSHTGFQGSLRGRASCTIKVPHANIPSKAPQQSC